MFGFGSSGNSSEQNSSSRKYERIRYKLNAGCPPGTSDLDYLFNNFAPNTSKKLNAIYNNTNQVAFLQQELEKATQAANVWHGRYMEAVGRFHDLLTAYADLAETRNTQVDIKFTEYDDEANKVIEANKFAGQRY